ncbi:unnamed protein product [Sphagnum jensenii]|uniref:Uncharacterized protein n=1 Tax=Sphagnum jensenii TaxID=128206 RepID=A0ABP0W6Z2_9BRYO
MAKPRLVAAKQRGGTWRNCVGMVETVVVCEGCCGCAPVVAVLLLFVHFAVAAAAAAAAAFSRFASCQAHEQNERQAAPEALDIDARAVGAAGASIQVQTWNR